MTARPPLRSSPTAPAARVGAAGVVRAMPLAPTDDAALARAAAQGHPGAARIVWDRFAPLVRRLLRRLLGPGDEIEDRVQETFLQLFRHIGELRDPGALTSFVVGITMRIARYERRRRRIRGWLSLSGSGTVPDTEGARADLGGREALGRLYAVLDRIDERARTVFILRHFEGLELADIGRAAGCSLATTKRRLAHANERVLLIARRDPILAAYMETHPEAEPADPKGQTRAVVPGPEQEMEP
jgi:RNA polymerase sigma-70 factor (ECF subfamily)